MDLSLGYAMKASGHGPVCEHNDARALRYPAGILIAIIAVLTATAVAPAMAADGTSSGGSETIFVAELGVLLLVGRLMGEAAQRLGQPAVMGQLVGGLLLGPSVFGAIWPHAQQVLFPSSGAQKSMIDAISQLGILMLLLLTGMETDLQLVKRVGRSAITVAAAGVAVPFVCGFALGEFCPSRMPASSPRSSSAPRYRSPR
jgi:hypothetical protein